jgi:3-phenylpropionate/cinnamic acid dioxygenase small subunit
MVDGARQIENLLYLYAERIDAGDFEGVADLFRHGRIRPGPDAPDDATFEGRDRVLEMYTATTRRHADGTPLTRHITTNAIIEVDEAAGTGSARSSYTVCQRTDRLPLQPIIIGRYHDSFRRIDGRWWFDTRVMHVDLVGDLSQHLLFALR